MIGSVVVLYNPTKDEIENINTYLSSVDYAVIVDNSTHSNEKLVETLVYSKNKIQYVSKQVNLGLCKALNIGVEILKEKGCEWALLFDADSKLGSDIDWSMTSGWLINIEIFKKQNGFFEELFVDGLDMDYCFKSHENGYLVVECGEAVINHHPAETKSFLGFKYGIASPYRYYMQARQLIWCWKRYKKPKAFCIYLYKWIKVILLFPEKKDYIKNIFEGTKKGIELWERNCKK